MGEWMYRSSETPCFYCEVAVEFQNIISIKLIIEMVKQYCISPVIERNFFKFCIGGVNAELCGHTSVPVKIEQ
jgi:hypothetical protein